MSEITMQRLQRTAVSLAGATMAVLSAGKKQTRKMRAKKKASFLQGKEVIVMKKSTFAAILIFLSAAVGALVAAYMYIQRREKELDEYEQLLFSEEFNQSVPDDEPEEDEEVPAPVVEMELDEEDPDITNLSE